MESAAPGKLDYADCEGRWRCSLENLISFLAEELRHAWRDAYLEMTQRATEIVRMQRGSFEYMKIFTMTTRRWKR